MGMIGSQFSPPLAVVLIAAVVVPFVAVMGIAGWYSIRILEQQTEDRLQEDIELIARAIQLPLSHALARGHQGTVEQALESAFAINRVYGVYVYDRDGSTIYSNGTRGAEMSRDRAADLADQREQAGEFRQAGAEEVYSFFVPLVDAGERVIGLLQLTRKGSEFDEYLALVRTTSIQILGLAGVLLGLIVLLTHSWWIAGPIWRFESSLQRVEEGELDHRLALQGPRELRALSTGINRMLDAIVASNERLAEQRAEHAALQEQLYQSEKMAALGQLSAGVAHELGSPLSIIDGKIQQSWRLADIPAPLTHSLEIIHNQTRRMEATIRQLLDYGSTASGSRRPVSVDYPLRSALNQERTPVDLEISIEMSPGASHTRVLVDPIRVEQALANLLRNALHAAFQRVAITCELTPEQVSYCFEDDGEGVAPEVESRIFDPFFTTKPRGQGTGLGLALAQTVAREHSGQITYCKPESGGARFCLILPLESAHA